MSTSSATSTATGTSIAPASTNAIATIFINPYTTISVKTHVPISLELRNPNFNKWKTLFRSMCGKFGLLDHLDSAPPADPDTSWEQADFCIRSWLFGSVADDTLDLAMELDQTARALWLAIADLFQVNKEPRAIFLHHEFHSIIQGDLSIIAYRQRMKTAVDALRDVCHPVTESQLILNLPRGVNSHFTSTVDNIASAPVLPSFTSTRNTLALKELRLANDAKLVQTETALVAASSAATCCPSGSCSSTGGGGNHKTGGHGGNKKKNGGRNYNRNGSSNSGGNGGNRQSGGGTFSFAVSRPPSGPWFSVSPWAGQQ
ncbi:uncharacterized protein [Oryza sativa Japonica Group]|uniref:uncharacterized protein n=1 Tax=Oryza sativa subsp. japonica TaxID=39947 RepID=UPI00339C3E6D